ncbi:UNVERIFIED_ORG: hypothetical protein QFZ59_003508 [Bacillus sp. B2I3]|nr:hypothetical protein [Bacillus sp. B2I3]
MPPGFLFREIGTVPYLYAVIPGSFPIFNGDCPLKNNLISTTMKEGYTLKINLKTLLN